jgi:hypothetical protein
MLRALLTEIELCRDLISGSLRCWGMKQSLSLLSSRIEVPFGIGSIQTQDCPDIILENTVDVESTGNQATCLKQVVVVLVPRTLWGVIFWLCETSVLIDPKLISSALG